MGSERISRCHFSTYITDEITKLSVKEVKNPNTFDSLMHATYGGLYDSALGPYERDDVCGTCGLGSRQCPGHFGHINLPLPVYHPLFFTMLVKILKGSCFNCHHLVIRKSKLHLVRRQLNLLDKGLLTAAMDLEDSYGTILSQISHGTPNKDALDIEACRQMEELYITAVENKTNLASCSKNATQLKYSILKVFLQILSTGKLSKNCPHCDFPIQEIRSEYNARLYLKPVSKKQAKAVVNKLQFKKACIKKDNGEEKTNDDIEEEEASVATMLKQTYLTPVDVKSHMKKVWTTDPELMTSVFGSLCKDTWKREGSPNMFFIDTVMVSPSRFRPISSMGEKKFENPQTANLNKILVDCTVINQLLKSLQDGEENSTEIGKNIDAFKKKKGSSSTVVIGTDNKEKLSNHWLQLQVHVNCFMDSDLDKLSVDKVAGIRQVLEKKEGLFRKHMMGKRVNYAARSVISPDPYIDTDEIGVPEVFAKKLTYPQPVTSWNTESLMKAIINGPKVHPGAVMVEYEDGKLVSLNADNIEQRKAIARRLLVPQLENDVAFGCKKVHRHLINGDILLLNRQPTLHRPSIMAHKARVLSNEKTIRLHYANCKAYNADFDGDEMNAHFPQSELGRAEAFGLVSTNYQYLSPKDGTPLSGLIQDHVISGVQMTTRNKFFTREEYHQLVFNSLIDKVGKIVTLPPCIRKPDCLWSGKQVFSTVLINIIPEGNERLNLQSKGKVSDKHWPKAKHNSPLSAFMTADNFMDESEVIISDGELLTGILDKNQYGATAFGLIHSCFELYGGQVSGKLLSVLARLFSTYLRIHGFSLGVEDILVKPKAEEKRKRYMKLGRECGDEAAIAGLGLSANASREDIQQKLMEAHHTKKGFGLQLLDQAVKKKTDFYQNKINTSVIPTGLLKSFPHNSLQLMIASGAKGSAVNAMQISSLLGQIELEGRRPPLMLSGKSLPSFLPYDTCARSGGFVDGRFLTGIKPQEYFFHCMAGREGLVDTAVKTSRSGYLQRCLIKHLEGLVVQYDLTVRDGDGSVVQFLYGEDGIDVCKAQFLKEDRFGFIVDNYEEYQNKMNTEDSIDRLNDTVAPKHQSKVKRWKKKFTETFSSTYNHRYPSPFTRFMLEEMEKRKCTKDDDEWYFATRKDGEIFKLWRAMSKEERSSVTRRCRPCPDPVICLYPPDRHFGSVSEQYNTSVNSYISKVQTGSLKTKGDDSRGFHALLLLKYLRSLASPGDAVGLLASQSIGEPSTQMTLNTFHFAGRGEMNVTLGIPRLREILMTASAEIKTPTMDVLVLKGEDKHSKASRLQRKLNRVCISQVLRKIDSSEILITDKESKLRGNRCRQYKVRLQFLPHSVYKEDFCVKSEDILLYVENTFIKRVVIAILKVVRARQNAKVVDSTEDKFSKPPPKKASENTGDESDNDADISEDELNVDGDAADIKSRNRQTQFASYEEPEEEEIIPETEEDKDIIDDTESTQEIKVDPTDFEEGITVAPDTLPEQEKSRIKHVLGLDDHIVHYDYDRQKQRWCEFTLEFPIVGTKVMLIPLIEQVAEKAVVSEAKGITKCFLAASQLPKEEGRFRLRTEGVNVEELWQYQDILDINSLYTNEIHAVAQRYGIEAARRVIIKEIADVFKVYGIHIDHRHLSLVGDYMTFEGAYKPFNRTGIETNPSPFQKMSFETTTHFLRSATAYGDIDTLGSPSSCIVVGKSVKVGTGIFQLQQPLQ